MRAPSLLLALTLFVLPTLAHAQPMLGEIEGQILLQGKSPLAGAPPLVTKGDMTVRDWQICAKENIPDERLVVDDKSSGIANIVVYLKKAPADMPAGLKTPKTNEVTFDQKDCKFVPHILPVQIGQTIKCTSQDATGHNIRTSTLANPTENFLVNGKGQPPSTVKLNQPENLPALVICDLHKWMDAYWVVTDHPYVAVTDKDGKFSIPNLPVGDHEFTVWHQTGYIPGGRSLKLTVKPGKQTIPVIKVPATHFKAKLNL